jgi:MFS family permease
MSADADPPVPRRVLPAIVVAQLAGTSLWFAVNAVLPDLQRDAALAPGALGALTSAVQFGFICGTLVFALLTIADRYSPRLVFLLCALAGALTNGLAVLFAHEYPGLLALRFATGFFLAGIYPVGMKIAAAWYSRGLGAALGLLIGALVIGTALPHGLRALGADWSWQGVMLAVSAIAACGGVGLYLLVPDSPHLPRAARIKPAALAVIWRDPKVRASAFGYFGHMWELYAVWALLPLIAATRVEDRFVSATAFTIIAAGSIGCAGGGVIQRDSPSVLCTVRTDDLAGTWCASYNVSKLSQAVKGTPKRWQKSSASRTRRAASARPRSPYISPVTGPVKESV